MRTPVVALLVAAIAGVIGFGAWAGRETEPRFCKGGGYVLDLQPGLRGYEVSLQDGGDPGPGDCDNPDRPATVDPASVDPLSVEPPASSTSLPPGMRPDRPPATKGLLVLGLDCAYRDVEGEVVARAVPNRAADGTCGIPDPGDPEPGRLAE
ncbi:MAG TPA: hypothetical protein VFU19_21235 [Iamia sp.]|nr:hypothetical protein [Iamia sp.]